MSWLQFWSSIVASLAWPVCVATIAVVFRDKLAALVAALAKLELPGGIKAEFSQGLASAEKAAAEALKAPVVDELPPPVTTGETAEETAKDSAPRDEAEASDERGEEKVERVSDNKITSETRKSETQLHQDEKDPNSPAALAAKWGVKVLSRMEEKERPWPASFAAKYGVRPPSDIAAEARVHATGVVMAAWKSFEDELWDTMRALFPLEVFAKQQGIDNVIEFLTVHGVLTYDEVVAVRQLRTLKELAVKSQSNVDPFDASRFAALAESLKSRLQEKVSLLR